MVTHCKIGQSFRDMYDYRDKSNVSVTGSPVAEGGSTQHTARSKNGKKHIVKRRLSEAEQACSRSNPNKPTVKPHQNSENKGKQPSKQRKRNDPILTCLKQIETGFSSENMESRRKVEEGRP